MALILMTYDPASPGRPVKTLMAGDYDPSKHVRWGNRPCNAIVDFRRALAIEFSGAISDYRTVKDSPVSEAAATALEREGVTNLRDVMGLGVKGLSSIEGVSKRAAEAIAAWADAHPNREDVVAEQTAEQVDHDHEVSGFRDGKVDDPTEPSSGVSDVAPLVPTPQGDEPLSGGGGA